MIQINSKSDIDRSVSGKHLKKNLRFSSSGILEKRALLGRFRTQEKTTGIPSSIT